MRSSSPNPSERRRAARALPSGGSETAPGRRTYADSVEGFTLPREARLRKASEFRRVYGRGRRAHGRVMVVVAFARHHPGHRIGVSVSKEHGPAVRRNKLKRILREAFRLERPELPGRFDLVLIPRKSEAKLRLDDARRELRELVQQLATGAGRKRRKPRRGRS